MSSQELISIPTEIAIAAKMLNPALVSKHLWLEPTTVALTVELDCLQVYCLSNHHEQRAVEIPLRPLISITRLATCSAELMNSDRADSTFEGGVCTTALYILVKYRICITAILHLVTARSQWSIIRMPCFHEILNTLGGCLYLLCIFFFFPNAKEFYCKEYYLVCLVSLITESQTCLGWKSPQDRVPSLT